MIWLFDTRPVPKKSCIQIRIDGQTPQSQSYFLIGDEWRDRNKCQVVLWYRINCCQNLRGNNTKYRSPLVLKINRNFQHGLWLTNAPRLVILKIDTSSAGCDWPLHHVSWCDWQNWQGFVHQSITVKKNCLVNWKYSFTSDNLLLSDQAILFPCYRWWSNLCQ